ncbi:MAG TPA: cupin domain-containing protein [Anaeromyxobacteraceae bacterium]|nr:cupin domain-containing protein [Anaeromyxobacteraceae bacterium]
MDLACLYRSLAPALAAAGSLGVAVGAEPAPGPGTDAAAREVWYATPSPGVHVAAISGKPRESGPYVLRIRLGPGARVAPHVHPDARTVAVISGEVLIGFGESFDPAGAKARLPGDVLQIPAGTAHFIWSRAGSVVQEEGIGPTASKPVGNDPPVGGVTPPAVWEAARAAYGAGEFRVFIRLVSPEAHDECLCEVAFLLAFAAGDGGGPIGPAEVKEIDGIARRFGLSGLEAGRDPGKPGLGGKASIHRIADKVGLYAEMMGYLRAHRMGPVVPAYLRAELVDLKIDGQSAVARLGELGNMGFDLLGEGWFIHPAPRCLDDLSKG